MIGSNLHKVAEYPSTHGRPKKFTPERIQQIINLVERGKSRAEIAELIGVSVGSLSVTCSRLGISLRRPRLSNGVRLLRPTYTALMDEPMPGEPEPQSTPSSPLRPDAETSSVDHGTHRPPLAEFSIHLTYKGKARTYRIPLTSDVLKPMALEAEMQNLTLGELLIRQMRATLENITR